MTLKILKVIEVCLNLSISRSINAMASLSFNVFMEFSKTLAYSFQDLELSRFHRQSRYTEYLCWLDHPISIRLDGSKPFKDPELSALG